MRFGRLPNSLEATPDQRQREGVRPLRPLFHPFIPDDHDTLLRNYREAEQPWGWRWRRQRLNWKLGGEI